MPLDSEATSPTHRTLFFSSTEQDVQIARSVSLNSVSLSACPLPVSRRAHSRDKISINASCCNEKCSSVFRSGFRLTRPFVTSCASIEGYVLPRTVTQWTLPPVHVRQCASPLDALGSQLLSLLVTVVDKPLLLRILRHASVSLAFASLAILALAFAFVGSSPLQVWHHQSFAK